MSILASTLRPCRAPTVREDSSVDICIFTPFLRLSLSPLHHLGIFLSKQPRCKQSFYFWAPAPPPHGPFRKKTSAWMPLRQKNVASVDIDAESACCEKARRLRLRRGSECYGALSLRCRTAIAQLSHSYSAQFLSDQGVASREQRPPLPHQTWLVATPAECATFGLPGTSTERTADTYYRQSVVWRYQRNADE